MVDTLDVILIGSIVIVLVILISKVLGDRQKCGDTENYDQYEEKTSVLEDDYELLESASLGVGPGIYGSGRSFVEGY